MKHNRKTLVRMSLAIGLCLVLLLPLAACNKVSFRSGGNSAESNKPSPTDGVKRTDTYTRASEKADLESKLSLNKDKFKKVQPLNYHLSATVTFRHEEDADRIVYEVLMDKYTEKLTNVIQSFTLNPGMAKYFLTDDLTATNTLNTNETNLEPHKEPYGLSIFRGYVMNEKALDKKSINNIYQDIYLKISYGSNNNRKEDYWYLKAAPSPEMMDYLNALK